MRVLKKNYKFILGIIVGLIIAGTSVYAATVLSSKDISYDNTSSGLNSTNVQAAIDEVYDKTFVKKKIIAYTYNETKNSSNYCMTGEEKTCKENTCYESKTAGSCVPGTIIKYMVNDWTQKVFYVLHDDGATITMQQRENTLDHVEWYAAEMKITNGPVTALEYLSDATSSWVNVNNQTYSLGITNFKTNAYTGCSSPTSCATNTYTMSSITKKARMITVQEANSLGCSESTNSCPIWLSNYLSSSVSYGGTTNDTGSDIGSTAAYGTDNKGYWTMSVHSDYTHVAWNIGSGRGLSYTTGHSNNTYFGIRAVVVISK